MDTLQEKLAAPLARERIKTRTDGRGGSLSYLETHDIIRTANEIFGFGGWGHEVVELRNVDSATVHNKEKKPGIAVGYVCIVKLTVNGCVPMSGVGFGDATEYRESGPVTAHELAAKEAESDALKRALMKFGDQFGLALYDKDAARSTHITSAANPAEPKAPVNAIPDPVTAALHGRILELAKEFGTNLVTVQKSINDNRTNTEGYLKKHHEWCERQVKTLEANIANKKASAESSFQPPPGVKDKAA